MRRRRSISSRPRSRTSRRSRPTPAKPVRAEADTSPTRSRRRSPTSNRSEARPQAGAEARQAEDAGIQAGSDRRSAEERRRQESGEAGRPVDAAKSRMRRNSTPIRSPNCSTSAIRSASWRRNDTLNDIANLGAATGAPAAQLSQSEIDALRARISSCWSPPPGIDANSKVYVVLRVLFKPDGSLVTNRFWSKPPHRRWGRRLPRAPSARCCCASRSRCSSPSITTSGRTSSSNSIPMNCSAADRTNSGT